KVIIGTSGAEYGIRGFVRAYNAATGAQMWKWYTIPSPQEGGGWGRWARTTREGDNISRNIVKATGDTDKRSDEWSHGDATCEAVDDGGVYALGAARGKLVRRSEAFVPQENVFAQPSDSGTRMLPGANGGQEWSPIAINPTLSYAYTEGLHQPMHYKTHYAPWERGRLWLGSAFVAISGEAQWGNVTAIDLATGKKVWQVKTDQPMIGGAT